MKCEITCEIQHLELPRLHPTSPPTRLQVQLLLPLLDHLLPHLHYQRTGELKLPGDHGGLGWGDWLEDVSVSLLVEMSPATAVPRVPSPHLIDTDTFSPGTGNTG